MSPSDSDNPTMDEAKELLAQVSLKSFTASPENIGPFGMSVLEWTVEAPAGEVGVYLNRDRVPKNSEKVVQPKVSSTQYNLRAAVGALSKELGSLTVNVNLSNCVTFSLASVHYMIDSFIRRGVSNTPNLYFRTQIGARNQRYRTRLGKNIRRFRGRADANNEDRVSGPVITFEPGRIRIELYLGFSVEDSPNPRIYIIASFGLDVQDGNLVARNETIYANVTVPWYEWLIPGAAIGLSLALEGAQDTAESATIAFIQGITVALNGSYTREEGMRLQKVQIVADEDSENGEGEILLTECPYDLLKKFADLSAPKLVVE